MPGLRDDTPENVVASGDSLIEGRFMTTTDAGASAAFSFRIKPDRRRVVTKVAPDHERRRVLNC